MAAAWRALTALVGRLPWSALPWVGAAIGWIAGSVLRIRRSHVDRGLRTAGVRNPARSARAMYRSLGTSAAEFLWLAARSAGEATEHVSMHASSRAVWTRAVAAGRGVVIAASHTGNWDLAACAMARQIQLLVVTKRLKSASLDDFWQSTRTRHGVTLAPASGAMARARATLRKGGAVAMMIDQVPASCRHAVRVDFLGRGAWSDRAPAALAARSGAPLVVAAFRRRDDGDHVLHVLSVLWPPVRARRAWIDRATVEATRALERFVREVPSQWLWLHRRWRDPRSPVVDRGAGEATLGAQCKILSSSRATNSRAG
jgi:Kdo2-lipid IVA lauroyltransferase/acyltransferase